MVTKMFLRRKEMKWSQYELGRRTGIHQTSISLFERKYRTPTDPQKRILARVLRMKVIDLQKEV